MRLSIELYRAARIAEWRDRVSGPNENQVKIRGIRVELGKIEAMLASLQSEHK